MNCDIITYLQSDGVFSTLLTMTTSGSSAMATGKLVDAGWDVDGDWGVDTDWVGLSKCNDCNSGSSAARGGAGIERPYNKCFTSSILALFLYLVRKTIYEHLILNINKKIEWTLTISILLFHLRETAGAVCPCRGDCWWQCSSGHFTLRVSPST